ncbi:putative signaling protein [invertebrate metagenome]|uniref:Putative signaling protein n=1 Tax=invertebrate metagenome TaxID=1711999 RepID=A0A2H9TBA1_9ZZZZ
MDESTGKNHMPKSTGAGSIKILVVDDRPENLLAMKKVLKPLGADIHTVDSGAEALSMVIHHRYAVILLDVQMPEMDGFETAELIHGNSETASIPVIFVTAISKENTYVCKGYEAGAVDYLFKPVNPDILLGKVKVFLALEKQRQALFDMSKKLEWASRKNRLLLDCADEGIIGFDVWGDITFINPAACRMVEGKEEAILGESLQSFLPEGKDSHDDQNDGMIQMCLMQGKKCQSSGWMTTYSGHNFPIEFSMAPMHGEKSVISGAVLVFHDVTERRKMEEQLIRMAKYDSLTGLANRTLFYEFLAASIARSERRCRSTVVLFVDLDKFKQVNDTLGHDMGDALLVSIAGRLRGCIREGDMVARLGGDEFAIILDDMASSDDVKLVADKIMRVMKEPHTLGKEKRQVGISIGIADYPVAGKDSDALIKAADEAMYEVKKSGRNGYRFYTDIERIHATERFGKVTSVKKIQQQNGLRNK